MPNNLNYIEKVMDIFFSYPIWIRSLVILWLFCTLTLIVLLAWYYPRQPTALQILHGAIFASPQNPNAMNVEYTLKNPTKEPMELTELTLYLFADEKAKSGLQQTRMVSGRYFLVYDPEKHQSTVNINDEENTYHADIIFPYANKDDAIVTFPLVQTIPGKESERIQIFIRLPDIPNKKHKHLEALFSYDQNKTTIPYVFKIQDKTAATA